MEKTSQQETKRTDKTKRKKKEEKRLKDKKKPKVLFLISIFCFFFETVLIYVQSGEEKSFSEEELNPKKGVWGMKFMQEGKERHKAEYEELKAEMDGKEYRIERKRKQKKQ